MLWAAQVKLWGLICQDMNFFPEILYSFRQRFPEIVSGNKKEISGNTIFQNVGNNFFCRQHNFFADRQQKATYFAGKGKGKQRKRKKVFACPTLVEIFKSLLLFSFGKFEENFLPSNWHRALDHLYQDGPTFVV